MGWISGLVQPQKRALSLSDLDALLDRAAGTIVTGAGFDMSPASAMQSAVVYACVNVLAQTIASLPLIVYRRLPNGGKERAPEHPLYDVLHDRPNPEMTSYELRACLVGHQATWGNAYCEIQRSDARIIALWPLRPDRMTVQRDDAGNLIYVYRLSKPDPQTGLMDKVFAFENIMHWRGLSGNGIVGYSPVEQAAQSIGVDMATREYGARFFGNDSRPGGILTHPGRLSDDAAKKLKSRWEESHRGLSNSQRVAVLEEGVTWTSIGIPPEQAQFLETRKYQRSEIAALYRIPLHMINDLERATFSNIEQQSLEFVKYTLTPWLVQIEQAMKRDLFAISAGKRAHFAEHLIEGLLRGDSAARAAYLQTMRQNGALNADEWREVENMNPIPGGKGKIFWQPANMLELGAKPAPAPAPQPAEPPPDDSEEPDAEDATDAEAGGRGMMSDETED